MGKHKRRLGGRGGKQKQAKRPFFTYLGDTIIPFDPSEQGPEGLRKAVLALNTYIARLSSSRKDAVTDQSIIRARLQRGIALGLLGEWQTSLEDFVTITQLEPDTAQAHTAALFLALAYDMGPGQDEQAEEEWNRLLTLIEPQISPESDKDSLILAAHAYVSRARLSARKDEYSQAIADCDHALTFDPTCAEAYSMRGAAYGHLEQMERAVEDCSKAIGLAGWPVHYYRRALVYKRMREYQLALDDIKQACQREPTNQLFLQEQRAILMYWVGSPDSTYRF